MTEIQPQIEESWFEVMQEEFRADYFRQLKIFLVEEKKKFRVYPPGQQIFNAFNHTPFQEVKVVLLGQDPYHGHGQAHGLCFSVPGGITFPPSLRNIFRELQTDLHFIPPRAGDLSGWARQGVLLLNATLTVRANNAGSHQGKGWEIFTDKVIKTISDKCEHVVFMLWGNYAKAKENLIDTSKHLVLKAAHPSPFSANNGFFGCRHFSRANEYLAGKGKQTINWDLNIPGEQL